MIEFKSDCGHTVRARDEDAGGVVRCSYCGRMANVPETKGDDLDFLFREMDADSASSAHTAIGTPPKKRRFRPKRLKKPSEFNPFSVVIKLCYAALLIVVVIFVGRKFVAPIIKEGGVSRVISKPVPEQAEPRVETPVASTQPMSRPQHGLLDRGKLGGLFVSSVPAGAEGFYILASKAPETGRINRAHGAKSFRADGRSLNLVDGSYVIELSFKWNDQRLTGFRGFKQFRKSIQDEPESRRRDRAAQYFLPDRADAIFVEEVAGNYFLVRQYRGVEVKSRRSKGVRGVFLPRIMSEDGKAFDIESLIRDGCIPAGSRYAFDEAHVRGELDFHGVRLSDQPHVLEALRRVGSIPCLLEGGVARQFEIDVYDGSVDSPRIMPFGR